MRLIKNENTKAMFRSAIFLIALGVVLFLLGYFNANYATAFLGISFGSLSLICLLCIQKGNVLAAKILWGLGTPLLIFLAPCLYSLAQPTTLFTYGFLYIGGMLYTSYSFQEKNEKRYMWLSIGLFFLGLLGYDRIIGRNFIQSDYYRLLNENYFHFKVAQVVHFLSLVYLIALIHKNKISIELKLGEQIKKLQQFSTNLILSSKNKLIHSGNLLEALEEILRNTAQVMDVSRISIWEINENENSLNMIVGLDAVKNEFVYEGKLDSNHFPNYLKSLLEEKIIVANDALSDPKIAEFANTYTLSHGIKSLMDVPFFIDGKFKGILCCEEQRQFRKWDEMDQLFSVSVGKLVSISYYCCMRKEQYTSLQKASSELEFQNTTMERINRKMMDINGELATDLLGKEEGLKELKRFMDEVSFKNAHHVRGPLSRMLGLLDLYQKDLNQENREKYIGYLNQSALELDDMIKEIGAILNRNYSKQ